MATFEIDDTKSAQENYKAFLDAQADLSYTIGDFTGTREGDEDLYTDLKIAAKQEQKKVQAFLLEKEAAFEALRQAHNDEMIALGKEWQAYEDNDYTIPK